MAYNFVPTGPWADTKLLQFVEEPTSAFGTKITASPTYTTAGVLMDIKETTDIAAERYRQLGSEDVYKFLRTGELYSFEVTYQPIASTTLLSRGITAQGGGTGTIDRAVQFVYTTDVNDVENYVFMLGCKADRTVVEITPKAVLVTQNYLCRQITDPNSASGLTTPTYASANSAAPWVGGDSGASPFTHNSNNYVTDRFQFEVTRQLDAIQPNGSYYIEFLAATNRTITGSFDIVRKDTTLLTDAKALTARSASYVLKNAVSTVSFTNMVLNGHTSSRPANAGKVPRDSFKFEATGISIT